MKQISTTPTYRQGEDKEIQNQRETIFQYLKDHEATASMISDATGVPQKNICRYKRDLEKAGRLWEIEKKLCRLTGFRAWYLTTNPDKAHLLTSKAFFDDTSK